MPDQATNIYRELQEEVTAVLVTAGVDAVVQLEPGTSKQGNAALNSDGIYVVVGYPTVGLQDNRQAQVDVPVQVIVNPEISNTDGFDLAISIEGALQTKQLDLEWWTELRVIGIDPTGTEDGLVVWTVRAQTRTDETVDTTA